MNDVMTVSTLREQLDKFPDDAPVMICVVKYPDRFALKQGADGYWRWDLGDDVEVLPLEDGDMSFLDGALTLNVELADYNEAMSSLSSDG